MRSPFESPDRYEGVDKTVYSLVELRECSLLALQMNAGLLGQVAALILMTSDRLSLRMTWSPSE